MLELVCLLSSFNTMLILAVRLMSDSALTLNETDSVLPLISSNTV